MVNSCPFCGAELRIRGLSAFLLRPCGQCGVDRRARQAIGRFDLREQLGASGIGILMRAQDRETHAECAVKLLHPPCGSHSEDLENFFAAVRAVMKLDHPHIAKVLAVGIEDEVPYIAREWVPGESLATRLAHGGRMPEAEVLAMGVQAALALAAVDSIGLPHRDLRLGNFIFADPSTIKLTDFGQAILYDCAAQVACIVWGAPSYNSPERLRFLPEDARSDIYALGATLFRALTGEPPYGGEMQGDVLFERLEHEATRVEALLPSVRPTTAGVVNRMLAADAEYRPQTWGETIALLTRARAAVPVAPVAPVAPRAPSRPAAVSATAPSAGAATAVPVRSAATSGSWAGISMLLALFGALGYGGWFWWHHEKERSEPDRASVPQKRPVLVAQSAPDSPPPATEPPLSPVAALTTPPSPPESTSNPSDSSPPPGHAPPGPEPTPRAPTMPPSTKFNFAGWRSAKISPADGPSVFGDATPMPPQGSLRIAGNTLGIDGRRDSVMFYYRELEGDWTLRARVGSVSGGAAGVMVREKTEPSGWCLAAAVADDGSIVVRKRTQVNLPVTATAPVAAPPQGWIELARRGPTLTLAYSADGNTFRPLDSLTPPGMGESVPAGFFACGVTPGGSALATFDHLALKTAP